MLARSSFCTGDSRTMAPQGHRQTGLTVDPFALLKREHDMILDQLAMIETAMSPRSAGSGVAKERIGAPCGNCSNALPAVWESISDGKRC